MDIEAELSCESAIFESFIHAFIYSSQEYYGEYVPGTQAHNEQNRHCFALEYWELPTLDFEETPWVSCGF